jgi:riboflavin synthase
MSQNASHVYYRVQLVQDGVVLESETHEQDEHAEEALGRLQVHRAKMIAKAEQEAEDAENEE